MGFCEVLLWVLLGFGKVSLWVWWVLVSEVVLRVLEKFYCGFWWVLVGCSSCIVSFIVGFMIFMLF